jgi:hypothetical protein
MSLKEFDAKQFLLEKGEQVGLGVAVTLMVLMLIWNLFVPPHGFFSGSPATKAKELNKNTEDLENALRTRMPSKQDLPEEREGKLLALDVQGLDPDNYATGMWFEPRLKEDKARRPPKIYNVEEAVAVAAHVPIDTYLFLFNKDSSVKILVLQDKERKSAPGGGAGGMNRMNPFAQLGKNMPGGGGMMMGGSGSMMPNSLRRQQSQLQNPNLNLFGSLFGTGGNTEYEPKWISADDWDPQQHLTAHRLQPLRMAIIAGSFPYKQQLEEHKKKLRLNSIDDVLNETIGKGDKQLAAFDFRGVEVQRMEVDADGKKISEWIDPQLEEAYRFWLKYTHIPFQPENPKYAAVMPNDGQGLVVPLLREFHASKASNPNLPMMGMGAMMMQGLKGSQPNATGADASAEEEKTRYPDVAAQLPKIRETLDKMREAQPKPTAAAKFHRTDSFNIFDRNSVLPTDKSQPPPTTQPQGGASAEQSAIPDYVLVRVVDVTIEPGKYYRYRLKIKMTNPNYQREDVASPEYKEKETLESSDWYELPQIVTAPPEQFYYVVDETHGLRLSDIRKMVPPESAQYQLLTAKAPTPTTEQVPFQFHRWVETIQLGKGGEPIPVGEWAVADRVFVARGEYVGRKVNVDIPVWKPTQNAFILPIIESKRPNRKAHTGIDVDFGQDPPENNLILVDFEGGRVTVPNSKTTDDSAVEVLMLSPEGKLLARNNVKDAGDEERKKRREEVMKRIQDVREGKNPE